MINLKMFYYFLVSQKPLGNNYYFIQKQSS